MRLTLTGLSALALVLSASPAFAWQSHGHDHDDAHDHGQAHDHGASTDQGEAHDHGDAHSHDGGHDHDHGDEHSHAEPEHHGTGGLRLAAETIGDTAAGQPVNLALSLSGPDGAALAADDLVMSHGHRLHVMIVDEGLEDYRHLHVDEDASGRFEVTFTPAYERIYRVWASVTLAEALVEEEHGHPHGDDAHGEHGDHHEAGSRATATDWITVGEDAAPFIIPANLFEAESGDYRFEIHAEGNVTAGEVSELHLMVTDADGNPVDQLEPLLGAYAHLAGFNAGASRMVHAHPSGLEPQSAEDRGGPELGFEITFPEAGVYRLFVQVLIDGVEVPAVFTVVAGE